MRTLDHGGWSRDDVVLAPPPHLAGYADLMWVDEWARGHPVGGYRIVADDAPHLILNVSGQRHRSVTLNVVGSRRMHTDVDVTSRVLTVGIRLKPGAIPALFRRSAAEFTDRAATLASLLTRWLACDARVLRVRSPNDALDRLTRVLAEIADTGRPIDWRANWLASPTAPVSVSSAADTLRVTTRALHAWGVRSFGMSLQHFFKIRRLHTALDRHIVQGEQQWSRVAATAGYADHSHLVRDCRALLGESPSAFVRRSDSFKRRPLASG